MAAALFAVAPSVSAFADAVEAPSAGAAASTETQSGTTTFFGKAEKEKKDEQAVAKKEPAAPKLRALRPTLTASVDLARQTMTVSENGEVRYQWRISSGTSKFATPTGKFLPQWKSRMWYSKKYDNAPMPNAVFINGGVAVHGTYHTAALGTPASHGCIRLSTANAKTFYNLVERHGMMATRVNVHGQPKWRDDAIANRDDRRRDDDNDYASNDGGGFFGSLFGNYDARPAHKNKKHAKADRRKKAGYAYKNDSKRRYSGDYAYQTN